MSDTWFFNDSLVPFLGGSSLGTEGNDTWIDANDAGKHVDTIIALGGNDSIVAADNRDILFGDGSITAALWNDSIARNSVGAFDGDDTIDGGNLDDSIFGGGGNDSIYGGSDNSADHLHGGAGNDTVVGGDGGDDISGDDGNDSLDGGFGDDLIGGDAGDDYILTEQGADTAYGGTGNDTLDDRDPSNSADKAWLYGGDGDDIIYGGGGGDVIDGGAGDDTLNPGAGGGQATLTGGTGTDIIDFREGDRALTADFGTSIFSGGYSNNAPSGLGQFEGVIGTVFSDSIMGHIDDEVFYDGPWDSVTVPGTPSPTVYAQDQGNDTIMAMTGNDTVYGSGGGVDYFDGGTGAYRDLMSYIKADDGVVVNLTTTLAGGSGSSAGDTVLNFEDIQGSNFNDTLTGDSIGNWIRGEQGDDIIDGGAGNDTLSGGTGRDTLSYISAGAAVTVNLASGNSTIASVLGTDVVLTDTASGDAFEVLRGSNFNDSLAGGMGITTVQGAGGDDTISSGNLAESLDGGTGLDFVDYRGSNASVFVDLDQTTQTGGWAADDSLSGFEGVIGSETHDFIAGHNDSVTGDTLIGNGGNDVVDGRAGNDSLLGGAGNDEILGRTGNDTIDAGGDNDSIDGGDGADIIEGGAGDDLILGGEGNDSVGTGSGSNVSSLGGGDDTLIGGAGGTETVYGGDGNDYIITDAEDYVAGQAGNDTINTDIDNDTIIGGTGNDTLVAGTGADQVWGDDSLSSVGAGVDSIFMDNDTVTPFDDSLSGGTVRADGGNDTLFWQDGMGSDTAFGGSGIDMLSIIGGDTTGYNIVQNTTRDSLNDWYVYKTGGTDTLTLFDFEMPCFATGTMIATARGEVAVEKLRVGDLLVTAGRGPTLQPVMWLGHTSARVARHPDRAKAAPVLFKAGSLGKGVPFRDLRVSPDHAMFLDGHLVPAKLLVNGTSIVQELWCPEVTYWHVELPAHALVVAEGALSESYLDDGNRKHFDNGAIATLFQDFESERANGIYDREACYPVLRGGEKLDAIRARLARAEAAPAKMAAAKKRRRG